MPGSQQFPSWFKKMFCYEKSALCFWEMNSLGNCKMNKICFCSLSCDSFARVLSLETSTENRS